MSESSLRIIFMGTPEFAVESLKALVENKFNVVAVITVPDKPAGRGQQVQISPVKKFAIENNIPVLQPEKLKAPEFIEQLKSYNADLQVVVAFRMLPEIVWNMPLKGTFNLHASLLPQYRGAAPINWAVINGEKETGATTFFLQQEIDTGKIIFQEKMSISENEDTGSVHDRLMEMGAKLVVKTVQAIESGNFTETDQKQLFSEAQILKTAPKIFKENCKIDWTKGADEIHNFIRGLSPYPAAYTELLSKENKVVSLKIFQSEKIMESHNLNPGTIITDGKKNFKIAASDGFINILSLQLAGKKRLNIEEFLRGFNTNEYVVKL